MQKNPELVSNTAYITIMKQNLIRNLGLAALALALPACAQDKDSSKPAVPMRGEHLLLSITGSIEAIDYTNREITLKGPMGREETYSVGEQVKRFKEAKVGDNVTLDYYVGVVAELRKPTAEEEKTPLVMLGGAGRA